MPWDPLPSAHDEPSTLAAGLDRVLKNLGSAPAKDDRSLRATWPDLVGDGVAAHAEPGALRDGVLTVLVDAPGWVSELQWLEAELVERLAETLGPGVVRSLSVKVRSPR